MMKACRTGLLNPAFDLLVTTLLWLYFTLGFVILFLPFYLAAYLFSRQREIAFQRLNHLFYRGFLRLLRVLSPGVVWRVSPEIKSIRSSVVVSNHLSYLDPLILISLFPCHKTIVKSVFFSAPIFGWMMKQSGFIPDSARGRLAELMIERVEAMDGYLARGGNLFVFPEGTRSRSGEIGPFNTGAFKLARRCKAPIEVLRISGTDKVFFPGRFLFNALAPAAITVERVAVIDPDDRNQGLSVAEMMERARDLLEQHVTLNGPPKGP
ncbi:MAG: 1-acyl-sn-glycerol-3-phosphate acyltransferase [Deltaproteobacteria bacterium]|nr:1-acyl-sn-glycerol-3-phosphate acyltransferase [Deltaproteobacteria bacterium]